jgi:hypothetical protein
VGADDGVTVAFAVGLAVAESDAGEAVPSDEAASTFQAEVRGMAAPPAMKTAMETASAMAPAFRLAGSHAQERRPVARTYRPVSANEMARKTSAPPRPPVNDPMTINSAVKAPTMKVEARGLRGGLGSWTGAYGDEPKRLS